jgi:molybdopterin synthase catalytic subunit
MKITIQFVSEAILHHPPIPREESRSGALVEFRGIVRGSENEMPITGLRYEIYEAMAEQKIRSILKEIQTHFHCHEVTVIHRDGLIPVGETAIYVGVLSAHRQEAFSLLSSFMDRLKLDVPIWKTEAVR